MASRSLGTLTVDLIAKTGNFEQGMDKAARIAEQRSQQVQKSWSQAIALIGGGISVAGFVSAIKSSVNQMDDLSKAAQRVGISTEVFSSLNYAAKLADVSTQDLQSTLGKLIKNLGAAQSQTSQQAQVFKALGIATTGANGNIRDSVDVLKDFANRFQQLKGDPDAIAAGMLLFGKSFQTVIPLLKDGALGLGDAQAEADKLNQTISSEAGRAAEQFNDNITRLQAVTHGFFNVLATKLLPELDSWSDKLVELASNQDKLNSSVSAITNTLEGLAAVGHMVAASFKFITASIQSFAVVAASGLQQLSLLKDSLSHPLNGEALKIDNAKAIADIQNLSDSLKDTWERATTGINESFDAAEKNLARIKGEIVDFPSRQMQSGAGNFIDDIFGPDGEAEKRADSIRKALHGAFANPTGTGAAAAAKKQADALRALYDVLQKIKESADPATRAYSDFAATVRGFAKLGADAIKAGADVAKVQGVVAEAVAEAGQKLSDELGKPMIAAKEFSDALDEQMTARQRLIESQVSAIGMGSKEAQNQQELARVYQEGADAIARLQRQHELHPESFGQGQYEAELEALKQHNEDMLQATKDGQQAISDAQSDWRNGVNRYMDDFLAEQRDKAQQAYDFSRDFSEGFKGAFVDFISGAESAKKAFGGFIDDIAVVRRGQGDTGVVRVARWQRIGWRRWRLVRFLRQPRQFLRRR